MASQIEWTPTPSAPGAPRIQSVDLQDLDGLPEEALGVFCWGDVRPLGGVAGLIDWRLAGQLNKAVSNDFFAARPFEVMLLPTAGRFGVRRLFIFGLGLVADSNLRVFTDAAKGAAEVMRKAGVQRVVLAAPACRQHPELERRFVAAVDCELGSTVDGFLVEREAQPSWVP